MKKVYCSVLVVLMALAAMCAMSVMAYADDTTAIPDGNYVPSFEWAGGTGKVELSCDVVHISGGNAIAEINFSSKNYSTARVGEVVCEKIESGSGSTFAVPVVIGEQFVLSGMTTAMSAPHEVDYTCTVTLDPANLTRVYTDGFYTTTVSTKRAEYGWKEKSDGSIQQGASYPSNDYELPVTIQIKNGKIADVAYTQDPNEIMANTSSDFNYLLWAMEGHNVTDASYNYLVEGNYDTYHIDPMPAKNGVGLKEQIIAKNGVEGVDTVTAATITSKAIIDSVGQSLDKAAQGQKDDPEPVLPQPDTSDDIIPADGYYTAEADTVGFDLDEENPLILKVEDGKMTARLAIEQRSATYPYIYAGTEAEALAAGEAGWLKPVDYNYGYKYDGTVYTDVAIKSLDKPLHFVMFASGSGNWFNRLVTIDSESLKSFEPKTGLTKVEQKPVSGKEHGNYEYWYDEANDKYYKDEFGCFETTQDAVVMHNKKALKKVAATCTKDGYSKACIYCSCCDKYFSNDDSRIEIESPLIPALGHKIVHCDAVPASYTAAGSIEHWECENCHTLYGDEAGTTELKAEDIVVPQLEQEEQPMTVKAKTATVKAAKLKKKAQTLAVGKVLTVKKAEGAVTYTKKSGNKKITIAKKTGKVTVKKGLKKGTYKVEVVVAAAGTDQYKAGQKTVTFKVKVK